MLLRERLVPGRDANSCDPAKAVCTPKKTADVNMEFLLEHERKILNPLYTPLEDHYMGETEHQPILGVGSNNLAMFSCFQIFLAAD